MAVVLWYAMRRVDCRRCGAVTVELVPWASGSSPQTHALAWFLASRAKVLSCKETARRFQTSWDSVLRAVEHAVHWGIEHRSLDGIASIGVDELAWKKGHKYLTLVYQIRSRLPPPAAHLPCSNGSELPLVIRHARRRARPASSLWRATCGRPSSTLSALAVAAQCSSRSLPCHGAPEQGRRRDSTPGGPPTPGQRKARRTDEDPLGPGQTQAQPPASIASACGNC